MIVVCSCEDWCSNERRQASTWSPHDTSQRRRWSRCHSIQPEEARVGGWGDAQCHQDAETAMWWVDWSSSAKNAATFASEDMRTRRRPGEFICSSMLNCGQLFSFVSYCSWLYSLQFVVHIHLVAHSSTWANNFLLIILLWVWSTVICRDVHPPRYVWAYREV